MTPVILSPVSPSAGIGSPIPASIVNQAIATFTDTGTPQPSHIGDSLTLLDPGSLGLAQLPGG